MLRRLTLPVVVAAVASVLLVPAAAQAGPPKLVATVGPGFTISLTQGGKSVKALKAGTYTVTVRDKSNIHNFRVSGKGVNKDSGVVPVRNLTWTVKLAKGTYRYVCDPHASSMNGSFRVT